MNIHQIKTEKTAQKIGPLTIKKLFPFKPGSSSAFMLVSDSSGDTALKIWSPKQEHLPKEGDEVTFVTTNSKKSNISYQEYPAGSDKWAININECSTDSSVGNSEPAEESQTVSHRPQSGMTLEEKLQAVGEQAAIIQHFKVLKTISLGYSREDAISMSTNSDKLFSLYWFGERGI